MIKLSLIAVVIYIVSVCSVELTLIALAIVYKAI